MVFGKTVSERLKQRSPSKYLSLKYLEKIRESYYCNLDKGIDYAPCEVDDLIFEKQLKKDVLNNIKQERERAIGEIEQLKYEGFKWCSKCKDEKPFKEFHIDKSKKIFGLRSHCKDCRKPKQKEKEYEYRDAA